MPAYRYLIDEAVLVVFSAVSEGEQSRLEQAFRHLAAQPEQDCDIRIHGKGCGPELRGKWFGHWLVRYYVDSPVRQVVIVACEWT